MELSTSCLSRCSRSGHWTWLRTVLRRDRLTDQDSRSAIEKIETQRSSFRRLNNFVLYLSTCRMVHGWSYSCMLGRKAVWDSSTLKSFEETSRVRPKPEVHQNLPKPPGIPKSISPSEPVRSLRQSVPCYRHHQCGHCFLRRYLDLRLSNRSLEMWAVSYSPCTKCSTWYTGFDIVLRANGFGENFFSGAARKTKWLISKFGNLGHSNFLRFCGRSLDAVEVNFLCTSRSASRKESARARISSTVFQGKSCRYSARCQSWRRGMIQSTLD